MPAKHPCAYYKESCVVALMVIDNPSGKQSVSPLHENQVENVFKDNGRKIKRFSMISWGNWDFSIDDSVMHVMIHKYCPNCGHSVLMKMDRVMQIFRRFTAFAADEFNYQGPDGVIGKLFP